MWLVKGEKSFDEFVVDVDDSIDDVPSEYSVKDGRTRDPWFDSWLR